MEQTLADIAVQFQQEEGSERSQTFSQVIMEAASAHPKSPPVTNGSRDGEAGS